jgi:hypothetical protein
MELVQRDLMCSTQNRAARFHVLQCTRMGSPSMAKAKALDKRSSKNKVNVTVKIDKDLLRKIRIIAAEEGTSISGLVTEIFEERSTKSERYEQARKRALALMNSGVPLNWEKPLSRDEVHERQ